MRALLCNVANLQKVRAIALTKRNSLAFKRRLQRAKLKDRFKTACSSEFLGLAAARPAGMLGGF